MRWPADGGARTTLRFGLHEFVGFVKSLKPKSKGKKTSRKNILSNGRLFECWWLIGCLIGLVDWLAFEARSFAIPLTALPFKGISQHAEPVVLHTVM